MNNEAQAWADKLANEGKFYHASQIDQGENLFQDAKWAAKFEAKVTKILKPNYCIVLIFRITSTDKGGKKGYKRLVQRNKRLRLSYS